MTSRQKGKRGAPSTHRFTFVLIPGAGGDGWYWHLVAPLLRERGYDAVPVDLPASDDRVGLAQYADAVVRAIGNRASERIGVVAQSLGGFTAALVCAKVPAALLLLVNAMIPKPGETRMSGGGTQVMLRRSVTEPAGWSPAGRAIRFAS
jgi:pimeloyl-ACP methyl ester carboxylesterase